MTREHPILFSTDMVRALLDGTKSQTRRVVKWPVVSGSDGAKRRIFTQHDADEVNALLMERHAWVLKRPKCPHGRAGDVLWVREGHAFIDPDGKPTAMTDPGHVQVVYRADCVADDSGERAGWWFRAMTGEERFIDSSREPLRWRPSIHMARWASRITLEVTDVRVERLQDITPSDAIAEGLKQVGETFGMPLWDCGSLGPHAGYGSSTDPTEAFQHVWDSINGKRPGCAWADSPWVWRIAFRRVKP